MSYKVAVMKRTKVVTSPKAAVQWASGYVDETRKHAGNLEYKNGILIGKNYFTSRPPGTLTVHGYGKSRVDTIARTQSLGGNDAAIEYLREHCWSQRKKGRKIMGIRLVLSMDPTKVMELIRDYVDVDKLLVKVAEDTFGSISKKFYNGDPLSFILGVHHDGLVDSNASWVKQQKLKGTYVAKEAKPHIHAHVMLLPQTQSGVRISLSNHTQPGRDGKYVDMLAAALETYQEQIQRQVYDFAIRPTPTVTPEWEYIIREASSSALEDFFKAERIENPKAAIRFGLDKFMYHMRSLNKEELKKRHQKRRQQFTSYSLEDRDQLLNVVEENYNEVESIFRGTIPKRAKAISDILALFPPEPEPTKMVAWDLPVQKPMLLGNPKANIAKSNLSQTLAQAFKDFEALKLASEMQAIGELTDLEMRLGAAQRPVLEPGWIYGLSRLTQASELPHQEVLTDVAPVEVEATPGMSIAPSVPTPEVKPVETISR